MEKDLWNSCRVIGDSTGPVATEAFAIAIDHPELEAAAALLGGESPSKGTPDSLERRGVRSGIPLPMSKRIVGGLASNGGDSGLAGSR